MTFTHSPKNKVELKQFIQFYFRIINSSGHAAFRMLLVINLGSTSFYQQGVILCLAYLMTYLSYVPYIHSLHIRTVGAVRTTDAGHKQ